MPYKITVTKMDVMHPDNRPDSDRQETEIYRQTLEDFNLPKFVIALNKQPRVRKAKAVKP